MVAKLGAILLTCVFSQNEVFSGDDVDATSLLSLRGVVQTRQSCPVTPSGAKQVYNQIAEMVGDCREVIMGKTTDNNHITGATCPSGYMAITQHAECRDACDVLGVVVDSPSTTRANQPNGCFTNPHVRWFSQGSDPASGSGSCDFNMNKDGFSKQYHFEKYYNLNSRSMCMKRSSESWKDITLIRRLRWSHLASASTAKFYIQFAGDDHKYQLDNPIRDRKRATIDRFALTVSANADLTRPTVHIIRGPTDQVQGWKIKSLEMIVETGALVELQKRTRVCQWEACGYYWHHVQNS